jgi:hypothetical protein
LDDGALEYLPGRRASFTVSALDVRAHREQHTMSAAAAGSSN